MFPKPVVYSQTEANQRELSQQMKQVLIAASSIDAVSQRVSALESQLTSFETKFSNISKVVKLQQDLSERRESSLLELSSKVSLLGKTEKVVADLAYRISSLESVIKSQAGELADRSRAEDRIAALEERVSRLTLRQSNPAAETTERLTESEKKLIANLKEASQHREELISYRTQTAVEGLQKQIDTLKGQKSSPPRKITERLSQIEQELACKASRSDVQRLNEALEREIRSREASLMDSWRKDEPSKSLENRLHLLENQISSYECAPSLTEVSKHLGTGCGSFGVDPTLKENIPKSTHRPHSAKPRPKSQSGRRTKNARITNK